jgi:uroporphyrinogen-III synthase
MSAAKVLVTRPAREAARWVHDLRALGFDAVALPLIAIEPLDDPSPLHAAWQGLAGCAALMFVSAAAAEHFLAACGRRWEGLPRCWSTGPGTTRALREAGVPPSAIDAPADDAPQFDSELVQPQIRPGSRVLIVRGGDASGRPAGRDWLGGEIGAAGGVVETVAAYRRLAPVFGDAERRLAVEAADGAAIWLFSSSEAIGNLCRALPAQPWRAARAIATHERVADAARQAGFGRVRVCRPPLEALASSIESFA